MERAKELREIGLALVIISGVAIAALAAAPSYGDHPNKDWLVAGVVIFAAGSLCYLVGIILPRLPNWRIFRGWSRKLPAPSSTSESDTLVITVDDEEWHPFDYRALILSVRVTVENKTDKTQVLSGIGWTPTPPWKLEMMDLEVNRERSRLQQSKQGVHGTVPPRQTTIGWAWVAFAPHKDKGLPGYVISIEDGVGNTYVFAYQPRAPEKHQVTR